MHSDDNLRTSADSKREAKWSWKSKAMLALLLGSLILIGSFVGGYFTGRQTPTTVNRDAIKLQKLSSSKYTANWKDAVCSITNSQCPPSFKKNPLILLSMDGFAAEYLKLRLTPSLEHLMNCGVHPPYMNPVFPTKTFPNHYSIATGLFPAHHGIIDNTMYDPVMKKYFSIRSPEATKKEWWSGEPIWKTAKKQGVKTATYFWPGSDVNGQRADYYVPYNRSTPFAERIRQVFRWLDLPEKDRPDFITAYFEEPDSTGHKYGPQSENVKEALKKVDYFIDVLMEGLHLRNLIGCVNLIIVSDHGMESISCNRIISLHEMNGQFNKDAFFSKDGTVGRLRPLQNTTDEFLNEVQNSFQCKSPYAWIYQQKEFPLRWRYEGNIRIDPLMFDIEPQWLTTDKIIRKDQVKPRDCTGGDHGYDNMDEDMWSIFTASGPAFKSGHVVEPFMNIQIYNLLAVLLGVQPSANNGTYGALFHLLKTPPPYPFDVPDANLVLCNENKLLYGNSSGCWATYNTKEDSSEINISELAMWGFPQDKSTETDRKICLLVNENYLIGYSKTIRSPIWVMYNLSPEIKLDYIYNSSIYELPFKAENRLNDPRLSPEEALTCNYNSNGDPFYDEMDILYFPLALTESTKDLGGHVITNTVPMYRGFFQGILKPLLTKLETWRFYFPHMNVISGPAWNSKNSNKNAENDLPSHYYFIFTFCSKTEFSVNSLNCSHDQLDTLGFILPHISFLPSCWDSTKFLEKHQASVDVIENLTGLKFFVDMPHEMSLRLRLKLLQTSYISISSERKSRQI
ncbi:hypothetical protein CHUAL_007843 [Chamberlinius hualienensis]